MTAPPYLNQLSRRTSLFIAVMLAIGASVCTTTAAATTASARPNATVCQRQPGHAIFRRDSIRVFRKSHHVYGCVRGHTRRVLLWVKGPDPLQQNSVQGWAGNNIAVQSSLSDQYGFSQSIKVVNLVDGVSYGIESYGGQVETGTTAGEPLQAFALSTTGRTARLYETPAPGSFPPVPPTGQVLDVVGPDHYDRTLATTTPGAIPPSSLSFHGSTVSWTENGTQRSAEVRGDRRVQASRASRLSGRGPAAATTITGGTAQQRSLLRQIIAGLAPIHVPPLRIVPVRGGVDLQGPATGLGSLSTWAAWVVGDAFLERSISEHLPPVVEVDAGGSGAPRSNIGDGPLPPRATPARVRATRERIDHLAVASGARIEQLTVSAPAALAVVLRVRVSNAAQFLKERLKPVVLGAWADESRYDGLYIEVDDVHGSAWMDGETLLLAEGFVRKSLIADDPFPMPTASTVPTSGMVKSTDKSIVVARASATAPSGRVRSCAASQLRLALVRVLGATGHRSWDLAFSNVGSTSCSLRGYPSVELVGRSGRAIGPRVLRDRLFRTETVDLAPGQRAFFTLVYAIAGPCRPRSFNADGLAVIPPGAGRRLVLRHQLAVCDQALGGNPTISTVRTRLGNL